MTNEELFSKAQVAALLTDREVVGYLSQDGTAITTWTGEKLASVTRTKTARVGFVGHNGKRPLRYFLTAVDVHGAHTWRAQSAGPHMIAVMRRK